MIEKDYILEQINRIRNGKKTTARNSMGCSEDWYNVYFSISQTFTDETLNNMSEEELNHLCMLASKIADALY